MNYESGEVHSTRHPLKNQARCSCLTFIQTLQVTSYFPLEIRGVGAGGKQTNKQKTKQKQKETAPQWNLLRQIFIIYFLFISD